ncbi:MAG: heparin lyase I family protein [Actinomycetota bacterium]|nr:heparin lyase I family protein [Actinomycetota bacterium]
MPRNLAAVAITVLLALPAAAHAGRTVSVGPLNQSRADVTFAEGSASAPDSTILTHLGGLIDRAETGSHIGGAIYRIPDEGRIEIDLREAAKRGVDIWLVVDHLGQAAPTAGVPELGIFGDWDAGPRARLHIKECERGCLSYTPAGPNGDPPASIQHMKYFTFSRTRRYVNGDFSPATWVSSANLNADTGTNAWNNAVSVFDDAGLNAAVEVAFRDQWNGADGRWGPNFDYYTWPNPNPAGTEGKGQFSASISGTTGIFSPEQQTDLWETQLKLLKGPGEGGATDCRVTVLHNFLEDARLAAIDELARLSRNGCEVRIAVNYVDREPPDSDYVDIGPQAKELLCTTPGDLRIIAVRKLHHKAIAAYGTFNGAYRATVWTGSHNLTGPALNRNDEMLFRVDNAPKLADEFRNEYGLASSNAAQEVCTAPPGGPPAYTTTFQDSFEGATFPQEFALGAWCIQSCAGTGKFLDGTGAYFNRITPSGYAAVDGTKVIESGLTSTSTRAEIQCHSTVTPHQCAGAEGAEMVYEWSFRVPSDVTIPDQPHARRPNIMQTKTAGHGAPDDAGSCYGGGMLVRRSSDPSKFELLQNIRGGAITLLGGGCTVSRETVYPLGTFSKGTWHRVALHAKWSSNASVGFERMWIDGVEVMPKQTQETLISGAKSQMFRLGLYNSINNQPAGNSNNWRVQYDHVRIGTR